ncbi:serpin family protein [Streptomyces cupreus]|uniref:Proteinase inhibitor I4 serpin n=1 Tax=Streptomyces cupreus TaxID=2759956 RepID=A0A7X1IY46_9ACTN|nr:serpin family protein [Streptomyces cupreus]MBC2900721.1 proteinase inhibitor I4 serpin [Streptomyces cupreus]
MRVTNATIRAVNGLTARWAGVAEGGTVLSAAGVWPLLAFLADGAAGRAREELADAVGMPADRAAAAARELLAALGSAPGLDSALGLWTRRTLQLHERWRSGLPTDAHGVLTGDLLADRNALDTWAAERTGGLVEKMPVKLTDAAELVLASALAMRTRWLRPFRETPWCPEGGPWGEGEVYLGLRRSSTLLDRVGVADTPDGHVTELRVYGTGALDVHLVLGEEGMTPGQVLRAGVDLLTDRDRVVPGDRLPYGEVGPGVRVTKVRAMRPAPPTLDVTTAAYEVRASHDLLERHELFGLTTARTAIPGHFPGVSDFPLCIDSAQQAAVAKFGALGFEAAAVSAMAAVAGGIPELRWVVTTVDAVFDRPFAFLAVHRHTRLVLAAGWVTEPVPFTGSQW